MSEQVPHMAVRLKWSRSFSMLMTAVVALGIGAILGARVLHSVGNFEMTPAPVANVAARPATAALWLSDFETEGEYAVRWTVEYAYAARSTEHVAHGRAAALVTFLNAKAPSFSMGDYLISDHARSDWSRYATLTFDVYNDGPTEERLTLQLKDRRGQLYKEELVFAPAAWHHIAVSLDTLGSSLDLTHMTQLTLTRWVPGHEFSLFLDAVRLEPQGGHAVTANALSPLPVPSAAASADQRAQWRVLGWTSSLTKLSRDPGAFRGYQSGSMQLSLARGEYESAQLVLVGGATPTRVRVSVSPLVDEQGSATISAGYIEVRRVGYVKTAQPYYPVTYVGEWPDPLPLANDVDVPVRQVQPIWITVGAHTQLPAGRYHGTITVTDQDGRTMTVPLEVTVWDFTLPQTAHLKTAFDFYRSRLELAYREFIHGGDAWEGRMDELEQRYLLDLLKHRISPVMGLEPSSPQFARIIGLYLNRGLSVFGIGSYGGSHGNNWPTEPAQFAKAMAWYRQAVLDLKFQRLLDQAYIYAYDEPQPGDPRVAQVLEALHQIEPQLKTLLVMHEPPDPVAQAQWLKDADIVCLRLTAYTPERAQQLKALGKELWLYTSSPTPPYPSLVIDAPAMEPRILAWMAWKSGAQGLLYWCVNFWSADPWTSTTNYASDQNGNGALYYPVIDGPVPSMRLEVLRDGIEDYEYLYLLRELVGRVRAMPAAMSDGATQQMLGQAERLLNVDPALVDSLRHYASDPKILLEQRRLIAEVLVQLQQRLAGLQPKG